MDRPSRRLGWHAGFVLFVVAVTLGLALVAFVPNSVASPAAAHGTVAPRTAIQPVAPKAAPAAHTSVHPSQSPTQATLWLVTPLGTYTILPFTTTLSIMVTNSSIDPGVNTTLWLNITDYSTHTNCVSNDITDLVSPAASTEYVSFALTNSYFANDTKNCPTIGGDVVILNLTLIQNGGPNGVVVTQGVQYGIISVVEGIGWGVIPTSSFIFSQPTSKLNVVPVANLPQTMLSANYTGQFVGKVQLTIYSPNGASVVYSANLHWNGSTPTVVTWTEVTSGVYPYVLTVFTGYGSYNNTGTITVPLLAVHYNNATFSNQTFIKGLSAGASGTLLLVVGLIVGMIVAVVVGRLVWGGPKAAGPAQPWTAKPAATNECSVCGKSFTTPEELADHSKTEHGMQ